MNENIEEIAKIICKECSIHKKDCIGGKANLPCLMAKFCGEALYNAGYRKESDTAREILQMIDSIPTNEVNELNHLRLLKQTIAKKYGVDLGE